MPVGGLETTAGMNYFGRYGPSVRTDSLPIVGPLGGERLERLAMHLEYYMNYRQTSVDKPTNGPVRQPKLNRSGSTQKPSISSPIELIQQTRPVNGARSVSMPAIPSCSILKTAEKPTSPKSKKKSVRFASPLVSEQVSSEDLEVESIALPPKEENLRLSLLEEGKALRQPVRPDSPPEVLSPGVREVQYHFSQPSADPNFPQRVNVQKVCLENVRRDGGSVHGVVRVCNVNFEKDVLIRWTENNWRTVNETRAVYCLDSSDGGTDRFSFQLPLRDRLVFAICYRSNNHEFWDNNFEQNYIISTKS